MKTAVEMTGPGRGGKPTAGFPLSHCLRFALDDQIQTGGLAAELRSELDVSFVDVNLAQAKLLLLQAQDEVQEAFAELTRSLGSREAAVYQLEDEPLSIF